LALAAIVFLLWAAWAQLRRGPVASVTWRNSSAAFGLVSRYAHWATATLVLCLIPIGLFVQVLRPAAPERAVFLAVHETLGMTVLVLVLVRVAWLAYSPPPPLSAALRPWQRSVAHAVHPALYILILAMPLSGILLTVLGGEPFKLYGSTVALPIKAANAPWRMLHNQILPLVFYAIFAMHLGAVLKHHFLAGRKDEVRRMLR
jgi:cytochrome b561